MCMDVQSKNYSCVLIEFYRSTMCVRSMCDAFQWNDNINSGLISVKRKYANILLCTFCFPHRFKHLLVLTHLGAITVLVYKSNACNTTKLRKCRVIRFFLLFLFLFIFLSLLWTKQNTVLWSNGLEMNMRWYITAQMFLYCTQSTH